MAHDVLRLSDRICMLPVIHGSAESALRVRQFLLENPFDCLAVPLPPSLQQQVEQAIQWLPTPTIVTHRPTPKYQTEWTPESEHADEFGEEDDDALGDGGRNVISYVPIEPCQGVIAGIRLAMGEHRRRAFIDLETEEFEVFSASLPDAYALKRLPLEKFAAAIAPSLPTPPAGQVTDRIAHMAAELRRLEQQHESIVCLCSILEWPWIRQAYLQQTPAEALHDEVGEPVTYQPDPQTLLFMMGELPFVASLYERARSELEDDEQLSVDGVKELLLATRKTYRQDFGNRARPITPQTLSVMLRYIRNLTLTERRFTPDFYTLVMAAKQVAGDSFALHLAEMARDYALHRDTGLETVSFGIEQVRLPDGELAGAVSRLPGPPIMWRSCELHRRPERDERTKWQMQWNPLGQCSWPPEDELIENFRAHVTQRAQAIMGADLIKTEKFTTSVKDGIDMRDTLRNWHSGEIYVREIPPSKGKLDAVVMIFDSPADPREYRWRATWFAEHQNESTLAFFATDFMQELVGPGIGMSTYGGAMFLFPPVAIPDIWSDPRLDFTDTMEERLLAAACMHARSPHVALLSPHPPSMGWRRLAKQYKKRLVHVPLAQFSVATVQQLRMVHVLNGQQVRSYAQHFIRKA